MKPGYKTSEFWLSLVAVLVGAIMSSGLLEATATDADNKIVGLVVTLLAALGYTGARGFVKAQDVKAAAIMSAVNANPSQPPKP
jgi:hypothetical protein